MSAILLVHSTENLIRGKVIMDGAITWHLLYKMPSIKKFSKFCQKL